MAVATPNGGGGVLAYTSDLWFCLYSTDIVTYLKPVKPQPHKPVRGCDYSPPFAEEESEAHKERSELTQF